MLRQAENKIYIEGILAEVDLKKGSFKKDGKDVDSISGTITVKVTQLINGVEQTCYIPIHMFAAKYTNKGTENPAYKSIETVMTDYLSIAASNEDEADRVSLTADITMNEYYPTPDRLVSFPRLRATFVNRRPKDKFRPQAEGAVEFCLAEKIDEIVNDEPTGRVLVRAVVPQYGGRVDVIPFIAASASAVDVVNNYWQEGNTYRVTIKPNFTSETKEIIEETDFGDPVIKRRTVSVSELIIAGGHREPLDDDAAFSTADIQQGLADRKARLEAQKAKDAARGRAKKADAPGTRKSAIALDNLGF